MTKSEKPKWTPFESKRAREMDALPDKAGVFIVGEVKEKDKEERDIMRTYVVAPYVVGKYAGDTQKFYSLPKGGVENTSDKAVREGALLEVFEETGIDAKHIASDPPKKNGEALVPQDTDRSLGEIAADTNPNAVNRYEGVSRLEKESDAIQEFATITYPNKEGTVHKLRMYALWVDGIEKLKGKTKGIVEFMGTDGAEAAEKTAVERAQSMGLPSEAEMIQVLRSGVLPDTPVHVVDGNMPTANTEYLFGKDKAVFPILNNEWEVWTLSHRGEAHSLNTPDDIAEALEYFPEHRKSLTRQIKMIRAELEARGSISDESGVKLEDNVRPCAWIAEGADVIPLETYIDRIHAQAKASEALIDERTEYDASKAYPEAWFKQHGHRNIGDERQGDPDRIQHPVIEADGEGMVLAAFVGSKGLPTGMKEHVSSMSGLTHLGKLNKAARRERRGVDDVVIQDEAQSAEKNRVKQKISNMIGEMPAFDQKVLNRKDRILAEREASGMGGDGRVV